MSILKKYINDVSNFPSQGIVFRDISPLLAEKFSETIEEMEAMFKPSFWEDICTIVGVDARGFLFASALAAKKQKRLVLIRKAKKLPPPVISLSYKLEYGEDTLEMKPGKGKVLIVDDVLATGGTLQAAADLCKKAGYVVSGFATAIDLTYLNNFLWEGLKANSVIQYHD
jgi:adenine phosphoribosyltransferase